MSHLLDIPPVRAGEKILPAYNTLAKAVREWRWFKGDGIRLMDTPMGAIIMREPEPAVWNHPWRVSGGEGSCTVAPGTVDGVVAWYESGDRLDGLDDKGAPNPSAYKRLPLDESKFTDEGCSWIVLSVYADKDLNPINAPFAFVTQTKKRTWGGGYSSAQKYPPDKNVAWWGDFPLAMLRRTGKSGFGKTFQLAHFNIRCRVRPGKFWFFV